MRTISSRLCVLAIIGLALFPRLGAAQGYEVLHGFSAETGGPFGSLLETPDGRIWGTALSGGTHGQGSVYVLTPDGSGGFTFSNAYSFTGGSDGAQPYAGLIRASDGLLYGTTHAGGTGGFGTVFRFNPSANAVSVIHSFTSDDGSGADNKLLQASDGLLYGTTTAGGSLFGGTIFHLETSGNSFAVIHEFDFNFGDSQPNGALVQASDGLLYGMTTVNNNPSAGIGGTIFRVDTSGGGYSVIHTFELSSESGFFPQGGLLLAPDGFFYGTAPGGSPTLFKIDASGANFSAIHIFDQGLFPGVIRGSDGFLYVTAGVDFVNHGIFRIDTSGNGLAPVYEFDSSSFPLTLIQTSDGFLVGTDADRPFPIPGVYGTVFRLDTHGGNFSTLHSFVSTDGFAPDAGLTRGSDGFLYGTTFNGGIGLGAEGTVFKLDPSGSSYSILHTFRGFDGFSPSAKLVEGPDGFLYGTAFGGFGNIFRVNAGGNFETVFMFGGAAGFGPGPLMRASDGFFYGMSTDNIGAGQAYRVFKVGSSGNLSVIRTILVQSANTPQGLIQASDGFLYGTTQFGGRFNFGTVFRLDTSGGHYSVLHEFKGSDGSYPSGELLQASDGFLYGLAGQGSAGNVGSVFKLGLNGANFSTVHSFNSADGGIPSGALVQGSNGTLYGTTAYFGLNGGGTLFEIKGSSGNFAVLRHFASADGINPVGGLLFGGDGALYGAAAAAGPLGGGTVFRLTLHTLTIAKAGIGTGTVTSVPDGIACGADCSADFEGGSQVTLTATPDPGYLFTGWVGNPDCAGGVVTMSSDETCTAAFNPGPVGPAKVWVGLKNNDDLGANFDLKAEVFRGATLVGSGELDGVSGGGSGFNGAALRSILPTFTTEGSASMLSIKLSARISCSAAGHASGTARLWFNDAQANSGFSATINGVSRNFFLANGFTLATAPGPGPKKTSDVLVNSATACPSRPFTPFGTWSTTLP